MERFLREGIEVEAKQYEPHAGMEDGYQPLTKIITNGWIVTDGLVKVKTEEGQIICPFIQNKRGMMFIKEGDYIIYEGEDREERHVCGSDRFPDRYKKIN